MSSTRSRSERVKRSTGGVKFKKKKTGNTQKIMCEKCGEEVLIVLNANRRKFERRCGCRLTI